MVQVVNPDEDEGDQQVLFSSLFCALGSSTMDRCLLHAHCSDICFVVTDSARAKVTYETVIAVRYPELVADTPKHVTFGNQLADRQATAGGFMPIFFFSCIAGLVRDMVGQQLE